MRNMRIIAYEYEFEYVNMYVALAAHQTHLKKAKQV